MPKHALIIRELLLSDPELQRAALLFDKLIIDSVKGTGSKELTPEEQRRVSLLEEWLIENGVATRTYPALPFALPWPDGPRMIQSRPGEFEVDPMASVAIAREISPETEMHQSTLLRASAEFLRQVHGVDAVPLTTDARLPVPAPEQRSESVVRICFAALPTPADSTPWEAVLDFRASEESREKYARLENWISKAVLGSASIQELEAELADWIHEYQHYMRVHELAHTNGIMEAVVVGAAERVEELLKLKRGKRAGSLFFVRRERIALLQDELSAPGRPVAYLADASLAFGKPLPKG